VTIALEVLDLLRKAIATLKKDEVLELPYTQAWVDELREAIQKDPSLGSSDDIEYLDILQIAVDSGLAKFASESN